MRKDYWHLPEDGYLELLRHGTLSLLAGVTKTNRSPHRGGSVANVRNGT